MKKNIKIQISSERLMKNDELITLRGGTNTVPQLYTCYMYGCSGGWCNTKITDLYAVDCATALDVCRISHEGGCVEGPGCN